MKKLFLTNKKFFIGYYKLVISSLIFSVLCSVVPLVLPILEGNMLGVISHNDRALYFAGWLFGVGVLVTILNFLLKYITIVLSTNIENKIKLDILNTLSKIKFRVLAQNGSGAFTTRISHDANILAVGISDIFASLANIFSHIAFVVFILFANVWLGLFSVLEIFLLFFLDFFRVRVWRRGKERIYGQTEKADSVTNELVLGMHELKNLGNSEFSLKKAEKELTKFKNIKIDESQKLNWISESINILKWFLSFGFVFLSAMLIKEQKLLVSTFFVVYIYRTHTSSFLIDLLNLKSKFAEVNLASGRISEIINGNRKFLHQEFGEINLHSAKGKIEIKNLSFSYNPKKKILKNINAVIEPNQMVAITGDSGSGKTTLLLLLSGQVSPYKGEILIDDKALTKLSLNSQTKNIAFVPAKPYLFSGTIKDNLLRANPKAQFEQIVNACMLANIHHEISIRPKGYDTEILESNSAFSDGEKQRLALARAFIKNSKILLLDEPTSNLNDDIKSDMIKSFLKLKKSKTIIIATHDDQIIKACDLVLVLNNGCLVKNSFS